MRRGGKKSEKRGAREIEKTIGGGRKRIRLEIEAFGSQAALCVPVNSLGEISEKEKRLKYLLVFSLCTGNSEEKQTQSTT